MANAQAAAQKLQETPNITSGLELAIQATEEKQLSSKDCEAEKMKFLKQLIKKHSIAKNKEVLSL